MVHIQLTFLLQDKQGVRDRSTMKEIMDRAQNGIFCNLELKIEGNDNAPVGCTTAKELQIPQLKKGISSTIHMHAPFKRQRIVEEMCSLPCGNKPCTKIMESPAGHQLYFQSNNLTGDSGATVSTDTGHLPSSLTLDENEDLDDSLLELEEKEVDGEDLINLTSEEIDMILQESDDDIIDNSDSFKFDDVSGKGDDTLCERTYSDNSVLSLSLPNTSQLPKKYLVIDELKTGYLGNVLLTDDTVLKEEEESNQSLKSEQQNHNSVYENTEVEKSEQPYYQSVDEVAVINPNRDRADKETDERDHAASSNEAGSDAWDKMLRAISTSSSLNMLKEDNKLTLCKQNISEEKADDGRVKEHTSIPGSGEDEATQQKDSSKHKQSVVESPKEKEPQKFKPAKMVRTYPETRQRTRLNSAFDAKKEWQKRTYLRNVSNHIKESYKNQGPMQELLCLVNEVADRDYFRFQQHPSDLTTRNYMEQHKHFFKTDLYEWARMNGNLPRFIGIAHSLQRGPLP